jgi:hypothetical protein
MWRQSPDCRSLPDTSGSEAPARCSTVAGANRRRRSHAGPTWCSAKTGRSPPTRLHALGPPNPVRAPSGDRTGKESLTMSRMFCTLKEAAQTLHASEDQINALVEHGILQEFREGPHRLLRESDIHVLHGLRPKMEDAGGSPTENSALGNPEQRTADSGQRVEDSAVLCPAPSVVGTPFSRTPTASPRRAGEGKARAYRKRKPSPAATAVVRSGHVREKKNRRPRIEDGRTREDRRRKTAHRRPPTEDSEQRTADSAVLGSPARPVALGDPLRPPSSALRGPTSGSSGLPTPSVRQWFWMGLVQDRPTTIALLAGLLLLGLSALVAGICLMAERL